MSEAPERIWLQLAMLIKRLKMSEAAAAIVLAFNVGVMLGIGLATSQWSLVICAAVLLFIVSCYYHRYY